MKFLVYLKLLCAILISTGIFIKSIQIYGLSFYKGYIETYGFDYYLFQLDWDVTSLWAYFASQQIGFYFINSINVSHLYYVLIVSFFISLCFIYRKYILKVINSFILKDSNKTYIKVLLPFFSSYMMFFLYFIFSFFVFIWSYLPDIARDHGSAVATYNIEKNKDLCASKNEMWPNSCVVFTIDDKKYEGVIIVRNENLLGLMTDKAAITLTIPSNYYFINNKKDRNEIL